MRSSGGQHWIALDHVRALAAFLVFSWHFLHAENGTPVSFSGAPAIFPLALIDEGQTGVALFMTLSGYLFAKLLDDRDVQYTAFLWNRVLRLAPLTLLVIAAFTFSQYRAEGLPGLKLCLSNVLLGLLNPLRPLHHGIWSIVVEAHFYLLLPFLLLARQHARWAMFGIVALAVSLRAILAAHGADVHFLSYWTIVGRLDQFALGMAAFHYRALIVGRPWLAAGIAASFCGFYWWVDLSGGTALGSAPPASFLWIVLPTIEAAAYGALIAWYDGRPAARAGIVSHWIGKAGTWSFSIYLLHFFFVFEAPVWIEAHVMPLSNFYVATGWSLLCFIAMMPIGWLSYRFVERPFLRHRRPYLDARPAYAPGPNVAPIAVSPTA